MNTIKHIHEVIFLIEDSRELWTPKELIDVISNTWGSDVTFRACSGNAFPKEQALDFLMNRRKVLLSKEGKIILHPQIEICEGHEHEH